jgi:hypothetical protein
MSDRAFYFSRDKRAIAHHLGLKPQAKEKSLKGLAKFKSQSVAQLKALKFISGSFDGVALIRKERSLSQPHSSQIRLLKI